MNGLTPLGDPNALVCDGDVCIVPTSAAGDGYSGSVMSPTTASNAASSESASTNML
jgi:hypothetical protein